MEKSQHSSTSGLEKPKFLLDINVEKIRHKIKSHKYMMNTPYILLLATLFEIWMWTTYKLNQIKSQQLYYNKHKVRHFRKPKTRTFVLLRC